MLNSTSPSAPSSPHPHAGNGGNDLRSAAAWWEPRRVLYNIVLAAVFVALTVRTWPRLQPGLNASAIAPLIMLALLANLCYCAAYIVDLAAFPDSASPSRDRWRWLLWSAGTLLAVLFETYWFLDEILPPIHLLHSLPSPVSRLSPLV